MIDDEPDDEPNDAAETGRVPCRRGRTVRLAPLDADADDAELMHAWRSDPVAAYEIGFWPRSLSSLRERMERDRDDHERDDFTVLLPDGPLLRAEWEALDRPRSWEH